MGPPELRLAVPALPVVALPEPVAGRTRAVTVTGVRTAAVFGVVASTVAVPTFPAGFGFGLLVGFGFGLSVYHPVPVKVNVKVTFLHASWLTSGRSMSAIGFGAGTVSELPAPVRRRPR